MTIPTKQDFATEVRLDRLRLLWRATLIIAVLMGWVALNVFMLERTNLAWIIPPLVLLTLGALATHALLNHHSSSVPAWTYVTTLVLALGVALALGADSLGSILPFAFPVVIFISGLLLPPTNTLLIAGLASGIIFFAPTLSGAPPLALPGVQVTAIVLTLCSAVLAVQVAGDLYRIADWALANYQRERRVAGELFESQLALERSLARSTALGARLQDTNQELSLARGAAEEAKHFRGQFLANMSHELRTPLNAIIGFSETMLKFPVMYDGVKLPEAYEADLQQIYSSGRQLLTLINDILDLAKVDAGKLEVRLGRVELDTLIPTVVATASGLVGSKPIRLETDLPEDLPALWADEARVRQVLLNLYSNAAKFTGQGVIKLTVVAAGSGVRLSLSDTGCGIAPENLELIFEEFKQAEGSGRDPRSGAGLGLAISRQLLTLMGGRIWAESEPGHGSTFHVLLPAYEPAAQRLPELVRAAS